MFRPIGARRLALIPILAAALIAIVVSAGIAGAAVAETPFSPSAPATLPDAPTLSERSSGDARRSLPVAPGRRGKADLPTTADSAGDKLGELTESPRVPGRYVVVLKDLLARPADVARTQVRQHGGELDLLYRHSIKGYAAELSKSAVDALRRDPRVKYVVADRRAELFAQSIPNGIRRVRAPENATADIDGQNDKPVNADVAVIDTGIDPEHPDLNVYKRVNCVPSDPESEGECVESSGLDGNGHGTHVAGTIAAIDNGFGVVGVAPGARLWSIKVLNSNGQGLLSWVLWGVDWVASHGSQIEVANMSLGGPKWGPLDEAVDHMIDAGVVSVAAAGNSSLNAYWLSPAGNEDVLTVSALADYDGEAGGMGLPLINGGPEWCEKHDPLYNHGEDDALAWFSNNGSVVDISAPGTCIYSTYPTTAHPWGATEYGFNQGTSMAAPHVAGAAALLASADNPSDQGDVEAINQQIVDEGSQHWTDRYLYNGDELNGGPITKWEWYPDGVQEPTLDTGPQEAVAYTTRALDIGPNTANLRGGVNPNGTATTIQVEYGTSTSYGFSVPASPKSIGAGSSDIVVSEQASGLKPDTEYHFRAKAVAGEEVAYGEDLTFTTRSATQTNPATGIDMQAARLEGELSPGGVDGSYWFEYGKTSEYGTSSPPEATGDGAGYTEVAERVGGLAPDTTYHFRLVSTNENEETFYGADRSFHTTTSSFQIGIDEEGEIGKVVGQPEIPSLPVSYPSVKSSIMAISSHQVEYPDLYCGPDGGMTGTVAQPEEESLVVELGYQTCTQHFSGSETKSMELNECSFELHPGVPADNRLEGSFDIVCPTSTGIVLPFVYRCKITILPQTGLRATYENIDEDTVQLDINTGGVRHTQQTGSAGNCESGTYEDGELLARWTVTAKNEAAIPASLQATDDVHAARITAGSFPAELGVYDEVAKSTATFSVLPSSGGEIECSDSELSGSLEHASSTVELQLQQEGCITTSKTGSELPTMMSMNGCQYVLGVAGLPVKATLDIECEGEEEAIEYTVYNEAESLVVCTVELPAQASLKIPTIGYDPGLEAIYVVGLVKDLAYEKSGYCGSESVSDGSIALLMSLEGESAGQATSVFVTHKALKGLYVDGDESAEPTGQPVVRGERYPLPIMAAGGIDFTTSSGAVAKCEAELSGEVLQPSASMMLEAGTYSGCSTLAVSGGVFPTTVTMNSCSYGLDLREQSFPFTATLDVVCSEEGDAIEFKVFSGESLICTTKVGPQEGLELLELTNTGEGEERVVQLSGKATGVAYQKSGLCGKETSAAGALDLSLAMAGWQ